MRSQILIVLLAAMASARPVAPAESHSVDVRELQYSDLEALYSERERNKPSHHHKVSHRHPDEDVWPALEPPFDGERFPDDHHRGDGPHGHHPHDFEEFDHPHDFEEFDHPHGHHHGGPHHDILDNIIGFLAHQVRRAVPDDSSRILDGIRDFLSHETRDVHEHEHHHPRHPHPEHDVGRNILDFFASAVR